MKNGRLVTHWECNILTGTKQGVQFPYLHSIMITILLLRYPQGITKKGVPFYYSLRWPEGSWIILTSRHCSVGLRGHIFSTWGVKKGNSTTKWLSIEANCILVHFILQKLLREHCWELFFFFLGFLRNQKNSKLDCGLEHEYRYVESMTWYYWQGSDQLSGLRTLWIIHEFSAGTPLALWETTAYASAGSANRYPDWRTFEGLEASQIL